MAMEPTTPTGHSGRWKPMAMGWSVGVSLFGAVLVALIFGSVSFGIVFFVCGMATDIGNRRQVLGRRTERLWILTTCALSFWRS